MKIVRRDASFLKTQRLKEISKKMASSFAESDTILLKKLVAYICYNFGLTSHKALEYIELCCDVHNWVLEGDQIRKA